MKRMTYFIGLFALLITAALYWSNNPLEPLKAESKVARVSYVVDGDTLVLEEIEPRIRLWGVDAPERGEEGAEAATNALRRLSDKQQVSYLEMDRDRYGRIVARVFLPDQREINRLLIEQDVTQEYCQYSNGFYGHCTTTLSK